jgi:multicomponent Na+:H+ antiporter subunit E
MSHGSASGNRRRRVGDGVLARGLAFLLLWVVLAGVHASDIPAIVIAVPAATWVSLRLLPRSSRRPSLSGIAWLALRFPYQSVIAGVDVAVRALAPRMALRLPAGIARDGFTALSSLMPGTLPVGVDEHGSLLVHCLDTDQPVVAQMVKEEALFARATGHV